MSDVCARCGTEEQLQKHHISYDPPITQYLCVTCHRNLHGHGVGRVGCTGTGENLLKNSHEKLIMLCEAGASNMEIANAMGVTEQTASRWKGILGFRWQGEVIKKVNNEMEKNKEGSSYTEPKQIRADTSIMLGLRMVEESGLKSQENVRVVTEKGSGKIVIERMKKGEL